MINVFCNSHCFSQLAAFFIGARAERSTTENCFFFEGLSFISYMSWFIKFGRAEKKLGNNRRGGLMSVRSPRPAPRLLNSPNGRGASPTECNI